ncbi:MAG: hypothetical protein VX589_03360 [Myxococcota bacterium]|nr:hypothetical protein [Myxococcota bacterium]
MDAIQIYKVIHLVGIGMLYTALGGATLNAILDGEKKHGARRMVMVTHGLGMFLILLGGFGMLHRGGYGWPAWAIAKMVIWVVLGGAVAMLYRNPTLNRLVWWLGILLLGGAAYMAIMKPF